MRRLANEKTLLSNNLIGLAYSEYSLVVSFWMESMIDDLFHRLEIFQGNRIVLRVQHELRKLQDINILELQIEEWYFKGVRDRNNETIRLEAG